MAVKCSTPTPLKLDGSINVIFELGVAFCATGQAWSVLSRLDDFHVACLRPLPAAYAATGRRFRNIRRFML